VHENTLSINTLLTLNLLLYHYYFMAHLLKNVVLFEGITHLEDLPLDEFIRTVETLKDKIITEKLDGANLWFGLDENGLFTSREGKTPKNSRFYSVSDYAMVAAYNGFRAAHLALEAVEPIIRKYFQQGDTAEIEVLFGRQPNTVPYGVNDKNFIVILRAVNDTPDERIQKLANALQNKVVTVKSTVISSPDGEQLQQEDVKMKWEFTKTTPINTKQVNTKEAMKLLSELKMYLKQKNNVLPEMTNAQVAELKLSSVPKDQREEAKKERERVNAYIMTNFKGPIKELLLNNLVRKIKPFLQAKDLDSSEEIGVEGVVVRDPVSGSQIKIVDKDVFTAINSFNNEVRNIISGLVRTTDQDAPIEARGGVFGQAKIRIANLLGVKELAASSSAKRFISKFKQNDPISTADALAKSLKITNLSSIKTKISAILKSTLQDIDEILNDFKQEAGKLKLKLKTGKEIGISPEVMNRTLTAFAETKADINRLNKLVQKSSTPIELILALYGRTIESLFNGDKTEVKESFNLIKSLQEEGDSGSVDSGAANNGTEAQLSNPAGYISSVQTGAIASVPFKLLKGSKIVQRRKRNFTRPKKFPTPQSRSEFKPTSEGGDFSLIKTISEDWSHVKDMKFATDVDDSALAKSDVEFSRLRNNLNISDNVSAMDVDRYLDKAHELNNEVDSIVFGMETDDGSIVKVWVNAQEADNFEAALAKLLGQEDDVEKVINMLADKFDIVDVEWPESMQHGTEDSTDKSLDNYSQDNSDIKDDDNFDSNKELSPEDNTEDASENDDIYLGTESDKDEENEDEENEDEDEDEENEDEDEDEENEDEENEDEDEENEDEDEDEENEDEENEDEENEDEENEDEDEDEENEDEDEDEDEENEDEENEDEENEDEDVFLGTKSDKDEDEEEISSKKETKSNIIGKEKPKSKKAKDIKKESVMLTYGQRFKEKILSEENQKKDRNKNYREKNDLEQQEDPIVIASRAKNKKQVDDLIKSFPTASQKAIITLMLTLGAPANAMKIHKTDLRENIEPVAEKYRKNSAFRTWVHKLMSAISSNSSSMNEEAVLEDSHFESMLSNKYQRVIYYILKALGLPESIEITAARALKKGIRSTAELIMDDSRARLYLMSVAEQLGINDKVENDSEPSEYVKEETVLEHNNVEEAIAVLTDLLTTLGFDTTRNSSIAMQAQRVNARKAFFKLAANPTLLKRLTMITNMIKNKIADHTQSPSSFSSPQTMNDNIQR
jgi:hypothetical protein